MPTADYLIVTGISSCFDTPPSLPRRHLAVPPKVTKKVLGLLCDALRQGK